MVRGEEMAVRAGFADPVLDSQRVFRGVLDAHGASRPRGHARRTAVRPFPASRRAAAIAWPCSISRPRSGSIGAAATPEAVAHLRFHCGCPSWTTRRGPFALIADAGRHASARRVRRGHRRVPGSLGDADRAGRGTLARGTRPPAHRARASTREARLEVGGLPERFWAALRANHARFPRGVDVLAAPPGPRSPRCRGPPGSRADRVRRGEGRRARDRERASAAGRRAAGRPGGAGADAGPDRPAARARGGSGDDARARSTTRSWPRWRSSSRGAT